MKRWFRFEKMAPRSNCLPARGGAGPKKAMASVGNEEALHRRKGGAQGELRICCYEAAHAGGVLIVFAGGGLCVPVEGLLQEAVCSLTPRALLAKSRRCSVDGLVVATGEQLPFAGSLGTQLAFDPDNNPIRNVLLSLFYKEGNSFREVEMAQSHAASKGESGI